MTNNIKAHSVFSSEQRFPLYCWYEGQCQPQPAYLSLDLRDGEVDADYDADHSSGCPSAVFYGSVIRFGISSSLTADKIEEEIESLIPEFQEILDSMDDGEKTEETSRLIERLGELFDSYSVGFETEGGVICERSFADCVMEYNQYLSKDQTVDEFFKEILDLDGEGGFYFDDGLDNIEAIKKMVVKYWLNDLCSFHSFGSSMPKHVARYLKSLDGELKGEIKEFEEELNEIINS